MRSEIPFSGGRGGGSVRRAINRLMPSAPAKIGAVALVVLVVAGVGWAAFSSMRAPAFEVHADEAAAPSSSEPETVEVKAQVCVYVTGAVANPGVYSLDEGLRVCDAVEAAGGLTEDADASTVNLARVLSDGEHIALPTKAEVETALAQGSAGGAAVASSLVNINTADASALETLSGVGSATAPGDYLRSRAKRSVFNYRRPYARRWHRREEVREAQRFNLRMKRTMLHGAKALGRVGRANNTANAALLGEGLVEGPTDRATPRFPRRHLCPFRLLLRLSLGYRLRRGRRLRLRAAT